MNEQIAPGGIEWTRLFGRRGYTLNPIRGCTHQCCWRLPDGVVTRCYAKSIALSTNRSIYPNGFEEVTFHPEVLLRLSKLTEPSGVFIDSQSDLFGVGTKREWTDEVLKSVSAHPQHIFFALTKNPPRLEDHEIPFNLWTGISAPPTFMFGKELSEDQQRKWFENGLGDLTRCSAFIKWVSLEPLTLDLSETIARFRSQIDWAVIGAASNGRRKHQPDPQVFARTLAALFPKPVFFKGNIDRKLAMYIAGRWMDDFPDQALVMPPF